MIVEAWGGQGSSAHHRGRLGSLGRSALWVRSVGCAILRRSSVLRSHRDGGVAPLLTRRYLTEISEAPSTNKSSRDTPPCPLARDAGAASSFRAGYGKPRVGGSVTTFRHRGGSNPCHCWPRIGLRIDGSAVAGLGSGQPGAMRGATGPGRASAVRLLAFLRPRLSSSVPFLPVSAPALAAILRRSLRLTH